MCKKCSNNNCGGCNGSGGNSGSDVANALAQLTNIQDTVDTLTESMAVFLNGHPILLFDQADDVELFDLSSGWGTGYLKNWGICNGKQYLNPVTGKFITPPNMTDRVPVQAGGEYALDAVIGSDTINLAVGQLPSHNHTLTDTGHTHVIVDNGHTHGIAEHGGHAHGFTANPKTIATFNSGIGTPHNHGYAAPSVTIGYTSGSSDANTSNLSALDPTTLDQGGGNWNDPHTHPITIPAFSVDGTTNVVATGLDIIAQNANVTNNPATTGITIATTGSGNAVDIRQPSYAVFFAMKIY